MHTEAGPLGARGDVKEGCVALEAHSQGRFHFGYFAPGNLYILHMEDRRVVMQEGLQLGVAGSDPFGSQVTGD